MNRTLRGTSLMLFCCALWSSCRPDVSGAPCEFDDQCPSGQLCHERICRYVGDVDGGTPRPPDAGSNDGGHGDGGSSDAGGIDGGEVVDAGRLALGGACTENAACEQGTCVDGVCCDAPCTGSCEACSATGHCERLADGQAPHTGHPGCDGEVGNRCGNDGTCDGQGNCHVVDAGASCSTPTCTAKGSIGEAFCNGFGACEAPAPIECGLYVCGDAGICETGCVQGDDSACTAGLSCVGTNCQVPSCGDNVHNGSESGIDCGGDAGCALCGGDAGCLVNSDCQSGTCAGSACTEPTFAWVTGTFSACNARACDTGTQTRTVTCVRSDGMTVADVFCSGSRPPETQSCTNALGCAWQAGGFSGCSTSCGAGIQTRSVQCLRADGSVASSVYCTGTPPASSQSCTATSTCGWNIGAWGACSVRCGSGLQVRSVSCRNNATGATVADQYCGSRPATSQSCSGPVCTVFTYGEPTTANGPCYQNQCVGTYPVAPGCPAGYASTRFEYGCSNPNYCTDWVSCQFQSGKHYGCAADASWHMPYSVRQCTFQ